MSKFSLDSEGYYVLEFCSPQKYTYVVGVQNDTPYHEGVEYWYRPSLVELLEVIESEWSWMQKRELHIFLAVIGWDSFIIEDLLPDRDPRRTKDEKHRKGEFFAELKKSTKVVTAPVYQDLKNIYVCEREFIFFDSFGDGKCTICGKNLIDIDD
jgi:hypothetical protein